MVDVIEIGDCRDIMQRWITDGVRVQMCVTSPPYWGLRDYGVAEQIGLERTFPEFVSKMVDVFRLVRALLADDGTLWLNLGDSYAGSWGAQGRQGASGEMASRSIVSARQTAAAQKRSAGTGNVARAPGCKAKDLIGIPWRTALALQDDGWWLRQDIIWSKPNPMPESVRDRCTKAHEYLFLMSRSDRYYWDHDAIQEPSTPGTDERYERGRSDNHKWADGGPGGQTIAKTFDHMSRSGNKERKPGSARGCPEGSGSNVCGSVPWEGSTRNPRSVWTIPTQPYKGSHFATFPEALVERCILAGSRPGDVVFDPFMGSGTVARVAHRLGRRYLGCELNPKYALLHQGRLEGQTAGIGL